MKKSPFALCFVMAAASMSMVGCGAGSTTTGPAEETSSVSQALTASLPANATSILISASVTVGTYRYSAGTAMLMGPPFPPTYIAFVQRTPLGVPSPPSVYQLIVQGSYVRPIVSIAQGATGQLAFAATQKPNMSGSSPSTIALVRLDPLTLVTVASSSLAAPRIGTNPPNATVDLGSIVFTIPGDLLVTGTKVGAIPGEVGLVGGGHFQATYAAFASSTTLGVAPTQVLAW